MSELKKATIKNFAPKWFSIWFVLSCGILFAGGLIDHTSGSTSSGFDPIGAAVGMFLLYLLLWIAWRFRFVIRKAFQTAAPVLWISVVSGWLAAELDELINFPFNPLVPRITLWQDILLTTPMYIFAHLFWFRVLKKYRFSVFEALLTGGISLGIFEFFLGAPSVWAIAILPFYIMIHGVHMIIPKILFEKQFEALPQQDTKLKYVFGILAPALGTLVGLVAAGILAQFMSIQL